MLERTALALLLVCSFASNTGRAAPLDPVYLKSYGGTYSADCSQARDTRLEVLADRLVFASGSRELVAKDIDAMLSFFGRTPPSDFEIALIGEVEPSRGLIFLVYRGEKGLYIQLDGHPEVLKSIDRSPEDETRYARCSSDVR